MKRILVASLFLLFTSTQFAQAGETFEVGADSVLFSQVGSLVRVEEPGVGGATFLCFESGNRIRLYAIRQYGSSAWLVYPTPVYLCPDLEMIPGLQWKFPDDDFGNPRTAVAVRQELVAVPAGNFPNAWRVEVTRDDQPSVINEVYWYAINVGMVKRVEYEAGQVAYKSELQSYDVTGPGFFPLVEGNSWQFSDATVEAGSRSMGSLKDSYQR